MNFFLSIKTKTNLSTSFFIFSTISQINMKNEIVFDNGRIKNSKTSNTRSLTHYLALSLFWDIYILLFPHKLKDNGNILYGYIGSTGYWRIKICPLRGHILIARSSLRSQVWARLGRAIWSSRFALRSSWTSRFALGLVLFAYI